MTDTWPAWITPLTNNTPDITGLPRTTIHHPTAWRQTTIERARTELGTRLTALATKYPNAPAVMLANAALGEPTPYIDHYDKAKP